MNKARSNGGFTLIEMMCALLILVLLTVGIWMGMDAGTEIYRDSTFEGDSAALADILNTALGDILRYCVDVRQMTSAEILVHENDAGIPHFTDSGKRFVFTNLDYGVQDAYFCVSAHGTIQLTNLRNANVSELVNTGAYADLIITDFKIIFSPRTGAGIGGGYFEIAYTICSPDDDTATRYVKTAVRMMNE